QELEIQRVRLAESLVGLRVTRIHPNRLDAGTADVIDVLPHLDKLVRAAGRKILRVEDQHHPKHAPEVTQAENLAGSCLRDDLRRLDANLEQGHRGLLPAAYGTASMRSSA